jgi:L-iditol 2-dehydrogenase
MIAEVGCCAICGTDVKLATIGNPRCHPPRVIGHEMVGRLIHVGSEIRGFKVGERITLATTVACGRCPYCERRLGNMCPHAKPISYDFDGAFAQRIAIPPLAVSGGNVVRVPDTVPDEAAALSEPLSCAINAQELAGIENGTTVLVLGGGPLGAVHAELAKARGASRVLVSQRSEPRLSLLRKLEDVTVVDGAREDLSAVVTQQTDGLGADVVVVAAPTRAAHEEAIAYARKGGTVCLFASLPRGESAVTYDSRAVHYGELRIVGASDSRPEHVAAAVKLLSQNAIDWKALVTHRVLLDDLHDGLALMQSKRSLKVIVYPTRTGGVEAALGGQGQ